MPEFFAKPSARLDPIRQPISDRKHNLKLHIMERPNPDAANLQPATPCFVEQRLVCARFNPRFLNLKKTSLRDAQASRGMRRNWRRHEAGRRQTVAAGDRLPISAPVAVTPMIA
jgi:hypothetical protein